MRPVASATGPLDGFPLVKAQIGCGAGEAQDEVLGLIHRDKRAVGALFEGLNPQKAADT